MTYMFSVNFFDAFALMFDICLIWTLSFLKGCLELLQRFPILQCAVAVS